MNHTIEKEVTVTLELSESEFLTLWAGLGTTDAANVDHLLKFNGYKPTGQGYTLFRKLGVIRENHFPSKGE